MKTDDELVEGFKRRVEEKAKASQPGELVFTGDDYPAIGQEFAIAWTTPSGRQVQKIIRCTYINEGKGRMSFEFVRS